MLKSILASTSLEPTHTDMSDETLFATERVKDVLIVLPLRDLSELGFVELETEGHAVLDAYTASQARHVILDLNRINYFGSSALSLFIKLWKRVSAQQGRMIVCNITPEQREVLEVTKLDSVWPLVDSRDQAFEILAG